jgi:hypothetical protein
MKAILEFNLPEEEQGLKLAQRGQEYFCIIFETLQEIRGYLKHGHTFKTADAALEKIRETLLEAHIDDIE